MAEYACTSLIFTSLNDVPSWFCVDPKYLNWCTYLSIRPYIGGWPWLDIVVKDFAFVDADFLAVISSRFLQPFSELLQFFFTASHKIDIVSKPQELTQF